MLLMEGISIWKNRQPLSIERADSITFNPQKWMYAAKIFRPSSYKAQWNKIQEPINKGIEEGAKVIDGGSGKSEG
ncbi:hypothetical protein [Peribacillus sp. V2I11]|uniref:hypothetical protein n=1 Tax=Peribacillus sp. V2I11 TaxID=3042277 RepID=UPI00277FDCE1|nr:hypothetical protein [Peribacillus sp. V2I11]MDQ0884293.1 hypothetical protein [Peribacillus sp. V2I11]